MKLVIHHLGLASKDPARTIAFYERLLDGSTAHLAGHTVVTAGAVRLAVVPRREGDPEQPAWGQHLALQLPAEARATVLARLDALGAGHQETHGRLYTRDPDGLTLELLFE